MNSMFNSRIMKEVWDDVKEYIDDYKGIIRTRERNRLLFVHRSPQHGYRKMCIEFINKVAIEKRLHYTCVHLAVYILDIIMDSFSLLPDQLLLVTNVCLLLAAKVEQHNTSIPTIVELKTLAHDLYSIDQHKAMELLVLKFYNFNIMFPMPAHYTHYFMQAIICPEDLRYTSKSPRTLILEMHDIIRVYLDRVVEEIHFMQNYSPSILAAAIISLARLRTELSSWTAELERLTEYSDHELRDIRDLLLQTKPLACINCNNSLTL